MGGIGEQLFSFDQALLDGLVDDGIEDLLKDIGAVESPDPVLANHRVVGNRIGEVESQKLAVGDIDLDLPEQLLLRSDAVEIADEDHLEQHHRVDAGTPVVGTVEGSHLFLDEGKVYVLVYPSQQVVFRHQLVNYHKFHLGLPCI